jgi:N-acyl-D-amino-acid deacylase
MAHPLSVIGSDGLPHDEFPHPRLWGTFPRVLGLYVRQLGLLTLEDAIHKMTGRSAALFGMEDRGVLRPGAFADLVLFDPHRVIDRATFEEPTLLSEGIEQVWTNGVPTWVAGTGLTGESPGRLVRRHRAH